MGIKGRMKGTWSSGEYPVSVTIMDRGPFSAVVAEGQEVGGHIVTPGTRHDGFFEM